MSDVLKTKWFTHEFIFTAEGLGNGKVEFPRVAVKAAVWEGLVSIGWTSLGHSLTLVTAVSREEETRRSSVFESTAWGKGERTNSAFLLNLSSRCSEFESRGKSSWTITSTAVSWYVQEPRQKQQQQQRQQLGDLKPVTCLEVFRRNQSSVSRFVW